MSDETFVKEFGAEIRRRRRDMGWTLDDLATRAGLTANFVGAIELGKRNPSITTAAALARGLRIPLGELFGEPDTLSAGAMEVGRLYDTLDERVQSLCMQLVRTLAKRKEGK